MFNKFKIGQKVSVKMMKNIIAMKSEKLLKKTTFFVII